ncbi:caspase family protein, partial [Paralimibaculum aggregatum]|uniref:caspase family protein n=1 Tax=Paralimibaculum aggregatum TaxID=3036245 RepID=UPI002552948B
MAAERVALVIGNGAYAHAPGLANPENDAAALAGRLGELGFAVTRIGDAGFDEMRRALFEFRGAAAEAEVAVVYFAGHGLEVKQRNFLLPVDADPQEPTDLEFQALPLSLLRAAARPASRLSLVILDACRDNPFALRMQARAGTRNLGIGRGLTEAASAGRNELVAFAARAGTMALDGSGANSPYAAALVARLGEPGLEIGKLFRQVRDDVVAATRGRQEPALYGALSGEDHYLNPPLPGPGPAAAAAEEGGAQSARMVEAAFVSALAGSTDPADYQEYLARYPEGFFAGVAQRRLEALGAAAGAGEETAAAAPAPDPAPAPVAGGPAEGDGPGTDPAALAALTGAAEPEAVAGPAPARTPEPEPEPAPEPVAEPGFDLSPEQIREAQARLNILGLDAGMPDGVLDRQTLDAVAVFQVRKRLARTGRLDRGTFAVLQRDFLSSRKLDAYLATLPPLPEPEPAPTPEPVAAPAPGPAPASGAAIARRSPAPEVGAEAGAEAAGPVPPEAAAETPPAPPEGPAIARTEPAPRYATTRVNLRAGPSTGHPVVGALRRGEAVTLVGRVEGGPWTQVRRGGATVFVHGGYLSETAPAAPRRAST